MHRLIETLPRLRRSHPWLTDILLVVLVAVPPVIRPQPGWRPVWVQAGMYAALVLPLLWRRRRPVLVAALVTAAFWAQYLGQVWGREPGRGAVVLAAVLATLTVRGLRRAAAATVLCAAGCVVLWIPAWQRESTGQDGRGAWLTSLAVALLLAGAWVFGEYVRARRAYVAEFERRAELAESERLALARIAVAEERARIAREIHDVLAHSVSVMVLNAEGGRVMRQVDPAVVDRTLGVISATGREALGELRRLLEVLRTPHADTSATAPALRPGGPPSPLRPNCGGWSDASTPAACAPGWTFTESGAAFRGSGHAGVPHRAGGAHQRRQARAAGRHDPGTGRHRHRGAGRLVRVRVENSAGAGGQAGAQRPAPCFLRSRTHRHARTHRPVRRERRRRAHARRRLLGHRHAAPHRARARHGATP
ncbi:histidine kinase [Streptomyces sp. T1317-0309]|nr:histidine kinase [Streptomyces sp. T1317-0309]